MRRAQVGDVVAGRFELVRRLGVGSQGQLFVAVQRPLGREVALKLVYGHDDAAPDPQAESRFRREASALARLSHPCCVQVYDHGVWEGRLYLVMELVSGVPLRTAMHGSPWPQERALHVAFQISRGLSHAHAAGIIHRDLSPSNVMLLPEEEEGEGVRVKLVDFGLARDSIEDTSVSTPGQVIGTPSYIAPERIRGDAGQPAADVYAVGVILFELIVGFHPLRRSTPVATLAAIVEHGVPSVRDTPAAGSTPESVIDLIDSCTAMEPRERPADGVILRRNLHTCLQEVRKRASVMDRAEVTHQDTSYSLEDGDLTDPVPTDHGTADDETSTQSRPASETSGVARRRPGARAIPLYLWAMLGALSASLLGAIIVVLLRVLGVLQ